MKTLQDHIKEQMKNPEFAKEYDEFGVEYEMVRQTIRARIETDFIPQIPSEKK